ncbi:MAG: sulfatase-like hydrolase/transferase [Planctomycetota bacterium]|jgi:arylsulfatase|nr:sulfatase-like hydrolase/transferase [Planctomycetota bacterium]
MSDRPNVLLICTDHWPSALFGHRGHPAVMTPTLDQLARAGTVFNRCYSECPVCIPARRTLMTGTTPRFHGDRTYRDRLEMPDVPTLAGTFRDAGYQCQAVGKLHVYPQRDRIGFDDVVLLEEGRTQYGVTDDYEAYLADVGQPGEFFGHGMCNNQYHVAPWHLDDRHHPTEWATRAMCRQIRRRDPKRPGFWYLSHMAPHPPLVPPQRYLNLYRDAELPEAVFGNWSENPMRMPAPLAGARSSFDTMYGPRERDIALRAFYALCTHIDHQLRLVIGTLREEGLLNNTVIMFTADHGDHLGDHGLWAKRQFLEGSANVPMIVLGAEHACHEVAAGEADGRLVGWQDIMPTLLSLCGIDVPASVEGRSMFSGERRETLFGECSEGHAATRMVHDGRHKLIYFPAGNARLLFDLELDPKEQRNAIDDPAYASVRDRLTAQLIAELHSGDEDWVSDGVLVGLDERSGGGSGSDRGLGGQRGLHHPMPLKG